MPFDRESNRRIGDLRRPSPRRHLAPLRRHGVAMAPQRQATDRRRAQCRRQGCGLVRSARPEMNEPRPVFMRRGLLCQKREG